jgi:hypothetical protein
MGKCVQCGNDYDKSFEVSMGGRTMIFDSFECAIQALAPVCPHCQCRIIGHGVQRPRLRNACGPLPLVGEHTRHWRVEGGVNSEPTL